MFRTMWTRRSWHMSDGNQSSRWLQVRRHFVQQYDNSVSRTRWGVNLYNIVCASLPRRFMKPWPLCYSGCIL